MITTRLDTDPNAIAILPFVIVGWDLADRYWIELGIAWWTVTLAWGRKTAGGEHTRNSA